MLVFALLAVMYACFIVLIGPGVTRATTEVSLGFAALREGLLAAMIFVATAPMAARPSAFPFRSTEITRIESLSDAVLPSP